MTIPKNESVTATVVAADAPKNKQLSASVPAVFYAAFDNLHWAEKRSVGDIVREALSEYAEKHGVDVSGEIPA